MASALALAIAAVWPGSARAQVAPYRLEAAAQVASARSSEFDDTDAGGGGRISWLRSERLGLEAEINLYPASFPERPFSRARWEGLFGVTVGARFDRVRPFAKVRPGFLRVREAPERIACILIFPPPLACVLASGRTLFALDVGGGGQVFLTPRTFIRVDAGDRLLRYPGPTFDSTRTVHQNGFFRHDFRIAAGGGLRF